MALVPWAPPVSVAVAASWGLLGGSLGITDGRVMNPSVGDTVLLPPLFTGPYCSASCSLTVSSFALAACWVELAHYSPHVRPASLVTTGRTSAFPSRSKYSFEIVHLKEVLVRHRPRVVEYVPC